MTSERGFTMATVALAGSFIMLVVAVSMGAVNKDFGLLQQDQDQKQAYEAARAGLADYAFHLNSDTNYWTRCTNVPAPSAVNQMGSRAKKRPVPGNTGAQYAIELIPATGKSTCSTSDPVGSMIETSGASAGTFRVRSTGYSDDQSVSIVATFKRSSFLDFLYFTQLETSDPVTYGNAATIAGANQQCTKTVSQGRYSNPIPNSSGQYCDTIYFIDGESVNGPLHSNDTLLTCGRPTFGRTKADAIETSAPPQGWYNGCNSSTPNFLGSFKTNAPTLKPPATNQQLARIADPAYRFTGQTKIVLNASNITVTTNSGTTTTMAIPANGVIWVGNGSCSAGYSPFTATYPTSSGCGNVYVRSNGTAAYTYRLTIASQNDIVVNGSIYRSSGSNGMLGLIANNFVRVQHAYPKQTAKTSCGADNAGETRLTNLRIDAAILAIDHSFIVDHYNCGASLGTLNVNGAIAQKFRGAVGTFGNNDTGYVKNYIYDDRLRYISPPYFLDPVQSAWQVHRETLDN